MPMYSPVRRSREVGSSAQRDFASWFSRSQRMASVRTTPIPVMTNPPAVQLVKGSGLARASVVDAGTGYTVGDNLSPVNGEYASQGKLRVTSVDENGAIKTITPQAPGIYTVKPGNPAAVSGGTGSGAVLNLVWNGGVASSIYNGRQWSRTDPAFNYIGYDIRDSVSGYRGNGIQNGTQMIVDFMSDAPLLELRLVGGNYQGVLFVDGQRVSPETIKTDTSGAPYIYMVDWDGVAVVRHYRLVGINSGFGGSNTGSRYTIWTPGQNERPLIWVMGDSYTVGIGASQGAFNFVRVMADSLGCDVIADGISGSGWTSIQDGRVPPWRVENKLGNITRKPNYIVFALGYNDAAAGHLDTLQTNFRESVRLARQICPLAQIICIGPATPVGKVAKITAIREAEMALCTELNIPFIDIDDWVNSSNRGLYTAGDNVHPSDDGHMYLGTRIAEAVSKII